MKKLLSIVLAATILIAPLATNAATYQPLAQQRGFDYELVSQSPNPTLRPGDTTILWVKIKNTGVVGWNNQIRLGTSRDHDRTSQFINTDPRSRWVGTNRIKLENDNETPVGATTGFGFYITVPQDMPSGTYREYFQPVYDGVGWMKDIGIYWDITVTGSSGRVCAQVITSAEDPYTGEIKEFPTPCDVPAGWEKRFGQFGAPRPPATWSTFTRDYDYEVISQTSAKKSYQQGEEDILVIQLKNTGRAPWYNYGPHAVYLGTSVPQDRISKPIAAGYLGNTNRILFTSINFSAQYRLEDDGSVSEPVGGVRGDIVYPGQVARFDIPIAAPSTASSMTYREYFQPVVEGVGWMKDIGIYWDINVANTSETISTPGQTDNTDRITEEDINIADYNPISIWVDREHVTSGQSTILSWGMNPFFELFLGEENVTTVRNYLSAYVSCTIDQGIGTVPDEGSRAITNVTATTTFHMTCLDSKKGISHSTRDDDTPAVVTVVPYIPTKIPSLTAAPQSNGDVIIQWTDIGPDVDYYTLTYSDDPSFASSGDGMLGTNAVWENSLTFEKGDLEPNTTYYFKVEYYSTDPAIEGVLSETSQILTYRTGN